jgi:ATP-binding protein involved in chromosome partitioning
MNTSQINEILRKVYLPSHTANIVDEKRIDNIQIDDKLISFSIALEPNTQEIKGKIYETCMQLLQQTFPAHTIHIHFKIIDSNTNNAITQKNFSGSEKIKNIIAIASGKGGVGKSTISVNIACGLQKMGFKVGLMDADVYGPSMPTMLGLKHVKPQIQEIEGQPKILPIEAHGIKSISIGYLIDEQQAVVLRGPRLSAIIKQFFQDVIWGELDYLIIDLPPGTGDVQLSLVQIAAVTGAIIVTSPQDVAVADAQKALSMFLMPNIAVPILGIVENMSYFTPEELPDNKYYIFGKGGAAKLSVRENVPVLAEIPLIQSIRENSDEGNPAVLQNKNYSKIYLALAEKLHEATVLRNNNKAKTQKVQVT